MHATLTSFAPTDKHRVIDLVSQAGIDVIDWGNFEGGTDKAASNPKYCYEWSFVESQKKLIVLNLWHENMEENNGEIITRLNLRKAAEQPGMGVRKRRAYNMDFALQKATREELQVRVIVLDGQMQKSGSATEKRSLDPEPWAIFSYDNNSGDCVLIRGGQAPKYIDQFDLAPPVPAQRDSNGKVYVRSSEVRKSALVRSGGKCEWCQQPGFKTTKGQLFLETHHVIPLSEGGLDTPSNVIALCPNHHRESHYGEEQQTMRKELLSLLNKS